MDTIIGGIIGVVAAVVGSWTWVYFGGRHDAQRERRQRVMDFYSRFILDPSFRAVNRHASATRRQWQAGDKSILNHFLAEHAAIEQEQPCDNGATPHQNLSIVLHFWAAVQVHRDMQLLDDALLKSLMGNLYQWNSRFFQEFRAEYLAVSANRRLSPSPLWVDHLPKLDAFFGVPETK
jgi:hypothetical protein